MVKRHARYKVLKMFSVRRHFLNITSFCYEQKKKTSHRSLNKNFQISYAVHYFEVNKRSFIVETVRTLFMCARNGNLRLLRSFNTKGVKCTVYNISFIPDNVTQNENQQSNIENRYGRSG